MSALRRWGVWVALVVVVVVALGVGARQHGGPLTVNQRVEHVAKQVRCPTCRELSAAESDAKAAQAIRSEIRRRVVAGQSDGQIKGFLSSRFGADILLTPSATGIAALVWVLPVAGLIIGIVFLAVAFRRWKRRPLGTPSDDDRRIVKRALET